MNDLQGRRVNRVQPDQSLMLLKPTAAVPHEGKQVITPGSRHYQLIYQWIKEGVRPEPQPSTARPDKLEVLPADVDLDLPGRTQRVVVLAHYADGSSRDVTRDAVMSSSNIEVAKMDGNQITGLRRGEAAVLVRYEGQYAAVNVSVMGDRTGFAWAAMPEYNYVDKFINAKLQKMKILPSEECTDAEFIRRVYLDLTGIVPTADQARAFLEDSAPSREKREKLVDALIGSKDFVAYWSNKWADLLQCNEKALGEKAVWAFREWIRQSVAQNKPYDQFVRELIDAQGSSLDQPGRQLLPRAEGHRQDDRGRQPDVPRRALQLQQVPRPPVRAVDAEPVLPVRRVLRPRGVQARHPPRRGDRLHQLRRRRGDAPARPTRQMEPVVPYGTEPDVKDARDRQHAFAQWLASKDNPLFARSFANRFWSYFFGRGIIDPVDDIRASNPPVNPELLDALTDDFVKSGFDVQHLIRTIVLSRTYQLSVKTNKWNEDDKINFTHAIPRRLTAEQIMDAVAIATGTKPKVPGLPQDMRSVYLADGMRRGRRLPQALRPAQARKRLRMRAHQQREPGPRPEPGERPAHQRRGRPSRTTASPSWWPRSRTTAR